MDVKKAATATKELIDQHMFGGGKEKARHDHVRRMLEQIESGAVTGEKAHRWLGWAQCAIYSMSKLDLEVFKEINHSA